MHKHTHTCTCTCTCTFIFTYSGHAMDLSAVLTTKSFIKTICCKRLKFYQTSLDLHVSENSSIIKFYLDSPSTSTTLVSMNLRLCTGILSSDYMPKIQPKSFTFPANSTFLEKEILFTSNKIIGCYQLFSSISGVSTYQSETMTINIINNNVPLPAPYLTDAVYLKDGRSIHIKFSAETNRGEFGTSLFSCSDIFKMSSLENANCKWVSNFQLVAYIQKPYNTSYLTDLEHKIPNYQVSIVRNTIKSVCNSLDCSLYPFSLNFTPISIRIPSDLLYPSISLLILIEATATATNNDCEDVEHVTLDISNSIGNVGRPWLNVFWDVFSNNSFDNNLTTYLNKNPSNTYDIPIKVPYRFFQSFSVYTFNLTLINFFGAHSTLSKTITPSKQRVKARVNILSPASLFMYRPQTVELQALGNMTTLNIYPCHSSLNKKIIIIEQSYTWKVFSEIFLNTSLLSISSNSRYFKLPAYSLNSHSRYKIQVKVAYSYTSDGVDGVLNFISAYDSITINVGMSGVKAIIKGPNYFTMNSKTSINLDSSLSKSLDDPFSSDALFYRWYTHIVYILYYIQLLYL